MRLPPGELVGDATELLRLVVAGVEGPLLSFASAVATAAAALAAADTTALPALVGRGLGGDAVRMLLLK
jgi:hypothetical protein